MNIAIIPARGGSKRIPRKNVRQFCGQPMIAWPITAARQSGLFDHIIVSTDDDEIAEIAREAGAETPFVRPAQLADDHTGTIDVITHALGWAVDAEWPVEAACCIYATAAFIAPDDLERGREMLCESVDFVFPAVRYGHPPQRGFTAGENGDPDFLHPEHRTTRTQDLPEVYHDSGQFYWGTRQGWMNNPDLLGPRSRFFELPEWRARDIDRPEDWTMAEQLFQVTRQGTH